jgi:hypothetical protein
VIELTSLVADGAVGGFPDSTAGGSRTPLVAVPRTVEYNELKLCKGVLMKLAKTIGWSGIFAVSALTLAACGGSTLSGSPAPGGSSQATTSSPASVAAQSVALPDICTLITESEASAAFGRDPGAPQKVGQDGCSYVSSKGGMLALNVTANGANAGRMFDAERTDPSNSGFQDVTGIGDRAFITLTPAKGLGTVAFIKGSVVVTIQFGNGASVPTVDQMTTLGKAAAGRL